MRRSGWHYEQFAKQRQWSLPKPSSTAHKSQCLLEFLAMAATTNWATNTRYQLTALDRRMNGSRSLHWGVERTRQSLQAMEEIPPVNILIMINRLLWRRNIRHIMEPKIKQSSHPHNMH
eukprot:jgi/Hompol1/3467/HPOL_006553-RA